MGNEEFCTSCLATDVKMFDIKVWSLNEALRLLKLPVSHRYMCYECTRLLLNFNEFYLKCTRANDALTTLKSVTKQSIKTIDRNFYKLVSKLSRNKIDTCIAINDEFDEIQIKSELNFDEEVENVDDAEKPDECDDVDIFDDLSAGLAYECKDTLVNELTDDPKLSEKTNGRKRKKTKSIKTSQLEETGKKRSKCKTEFKKVNIKVEPENVDSSSDLDDRPLSEISQKPSKDENLEKSRTEVKDKLSSNKKRGRRKVNSFDDTYFEEYGKVKLLTPEEATKEVLLRKESRNYKNCPYKCDLCYRGYESKQTLENHMKKHSDEYGRIECEYCHLRFAKPTHLTKHISVCHTRKFSCNICPYICFCISQARSHISLHRGTKYACPHCNEVFSMPNSLSMHKRMKHATECACATCGDAFATERGLAAHRMMVHRNETNKTEGPKCEECNVQFATETAWKRHLVLSAKHTVINGCEFCGETFPDENTLKLHTREHARKQTPRLNKIKVPSACPICGEWLSTLPAYEAHMGAEHPAAKEAQLLDLRKHSQFVCEICGKVFKKHCLLQYHARAHSGERPYACALCPRTFAFPGTLTAHKNKHLRNKRYRCDICHKQFTYKSTLNKHVKAHLGIRPHKCSVCEKAFPNPCDVKQHMKYVHNKVPWPKRDRNKRKETTI